MGPIGSAVLTFIRYKHPVRQAKFMYRFINSEQNALFCNLQNSFYKKFPAFFVEFNCKNKILKLDFFNFKSEFILKYLNRMYDLHFIYIFYYLNSTECKKTHFVTKCANAWKVSLIQICEMSQNLNMFQNMFCAQSLQFLQKCDMF